LVRDRGEETLGFPKSKLDIAAVLVDGSSSILVVPEMID
jgi:hypothetical protein